jgi:hypothetical protein
MNNAGSPEPTPKPKGTRGCLSSPLALVILGVLMVVSAVVLSQAVPLLYTIAFPPTLSVPAGTELVRHTQYAQGVDEWVYKAPVRACEVAEHLRTFGIECPNFGCGGLAPDEPDLYSGIVTQCYGQQDVSIFKVQWTVMLNPDTSDGMKSLFQVYREMFWGGQIPSKRFDDVVEDVIIQQTLTAQPQSPSTPTPQP